MYKVVFIKDYFVHVTEKASFCLTCLLKTAGQIVQMHEAIQTETQNKFCKMEKV